MKRSFLKLVITSVLLCWALCFLAVVAYARSLSWTPERARRDGVFLAHQVLDGAPAADRPARLRAMQPQLWVGLQLLSIDEVERRTGRRLGAGESLPYRAERRQEWFFFAFSDGRGALAAGPVDPTQPPGILPIGIFVTLIFLPVLAGLIAIRVERQLTKVEAASEALAAGELGARVDNPTGPSNELAASFNAMAERIERLVRSRDELVQAVSHELGSPLSRLRFQMELIEQPAEGGREARLAAMTRELDALDELVAELLGYVQSDELAVDAQTFDARQTLADLAELATLDAPEERAVEVALDIPEDASLTADPRLFQRAVENLLRNAVRYAEREVRVEFTVGEGAVRVAVHDDGPGIPEPMRDKVLVPFVRLDADRARKTGGVGLGLAITSRILQRHGGHVKIDSSPLGGAMVETIWPKASG